METEYSESHLYSFPVFHPGLSKTVFPFWEVYRCWRGWCSQGLILWLPWRFMFWICSPRSRITSQIHTDRPLQLQFLAYSLCAFVLRLVTKASVVLTSCCRWRKHMAFSGLHEGFVGCNPHESLCWIRSSPLRQLMLKYWNKQNCKNGSEKPQILCEVCFPWSQHCQGGPWEDFSEVSIEARQGRVEGTGVLVLEKLPAGSLPSCWWGTEESLCV